MEVLKWNGRIGMKNINLMNVILRMEKYMDFEKEKMENKIVIGVDEVGRGCLAGPVVAAAVVWEGLDIKGLNDSKKLSLKQREEVFQQCLEGDLVYATGWGDVREIGERNILRATLFAMERAINSVVDKVKVLPEIALIDGKAGYLQNIRIGQRWIVKGDTIVPAIMAASVVAKVLRDTYMKKLVVEFPEYEVYGWRTNVGYGTKQHLRAIKKYGITPFHRKTFQPIKRWLEKGIIK